MRPLHSMVRYPLAGLLALAAFAAPALAEREVLRDETSAFPVQSARSLKIDVRVGEVHVDAADGDRIEARLKLSCSPRKQRCREQAATLRLDSERFDDQLTLKIDGYRNGNHGSNHPEVQLHLKVPAALAVDVAMGVGELEIEGIEGDVSVDLGVGETRVVVPESAVRSVSVDVGVGEAQLSPRQPDAQRHGFLFLGNEVDWKEGVGRSRVSVGIGVGEAHVRLAPKSI